MIYQYMFTSMYMEYQIKMYIYVYFSNKPNGDVYTVVLANDLLSMCLWFWFDYVWREIYNE